MYILCFLTLICLEKVKTGPPVVGEVILQLKIKKRLLQPVFKNGSLMLFRKWCDFVCLALLQKNGPFLRNLHHQIA
jgi:hypothetical protein